MDEGSSIGMTMLKKSGTINIINTTTTSTVVCNWYYDINTTRAVVSVYTYTVAGTTTVLVAVLDERMSLGTANSILTK